MRSSQHWWHHTTGLEAGSNDKPAALRRGTCRIWIRRGNFGAVLHSSDLLLCMAGTAAEQAVGLARPVLQLVGQGPQFTEGFAEAQRRLLGPSVFCAPGEAGDPVTLECTAQMVLDLLERSHQDAELRSICDREAMNRLGPAGGGSRMAASISRLLQTSP